MPMWTTFTLAQLRAATKAAILQNVGQYIADHFTKKQIIKWLVKDDTDADDALLLDPVRQYGDDGQVTQEDITIHDLESGEKVGSTRTLWTYYGGGEIDTITLLELDSDDEELTRTTIRHFTDGRQPIVE